MLGILKFIYKRTGLNNAHPIFSNTDCPTKHERRVKWRSSLELFAALVCKPFSTIIIPDIRYNSIRNSRFQEYFTINVNSDTNLSVSMLNPSSYGWWGIRAIQRNITPIRAYTSVFYSIYVLRYNSMIL